MEYVRFIHTITHSLTPLHSHIHTITHVLQQQQKHRFPIGIGIQIVGCLSVALGICVEKYAIVKLESDSESTKSVTTDPTYLMGFGLFIFGNALSALALSYAAASILAPLSCLNIVANVFFSSWLLSEQVTMNDITSTCIILTGAATVVIFSSDSDESEEETSVNLLRLIFRTESILYVL